MGILVYTPTLWFYQIVRYENNSTNEYKLIHNEFSNYIVYFSVVIVIRSIVSFVLLVSFNLMMYSTFRKGYIKPQGTFLFALLLMI